MPLVSLTSIPRIMRKYGFVNGARLMDIWLTRPASVAPAYSPADSSTIKMDWVLKFPRARRVYDAILDERIWRNPAAVREIRKMLKRRGLLNMGSGVSFFPQTHSMEALDSYYINQRRVDEAYYGGGGRAALELQGWRGALDDMIAALGNFNFRVVVSGAVTPLPATAKLTGVSLWEVSISEVGIYVRDSYDFNDDQFLGYWNDLEDTVSLTGMTNLGWLSALGGGPLIAPTKVTNETFRDYRQKTARGGDFLVFSDVKWIHLPAPEVFTV